MECIFCKIIKKEIPSKIIYEDEIVSVIMDNSPTSNGHILILPKEHFNDFYSLDEKTSSHIHKTSKDMKDILEKSLMPDGITLLNNYGINQAIKHYHLHMIPVYKKEEEIKDIDEIYIKIKNVTNL